MDSISVPTHINTLSNCDRIRSTISFNVSTDSEYLAFLESRTLNDKLMREIVSRPKKVILYREERWGPRVNSLYLKNKTQYDKITYRMLNEYLYNI